MAFREYINVQGGSFIRYIGKINVILFCHKKLKDKIESCMYLLSINEI